jgi:hypothetical protein
VETLRGANCCSSSRWRWIPLAMSEDYVVCVDDVGRAGDWFSAPTGVPPGQTDTSNKFASDYTVYGIIDSIDIHRRRTYDKAKEQNACNWQE